MRLNKIIIIILSAITLAACSSGKNKQPFSAIQANFDAKNYAMVIKQLRPLAEDNNPRAQYMLGYIYYNGLGTPQDEELALVWMKRAAIQGEPLAIAALEIINAENENNQN